MWSSARLGGGEVELRFRPVFRGEDRGEGGRRDEEDRGDEIEEDGLYSVSLFVLARHGL
jgi:hypothetical protein